MTTRRRNLEFEREITRQAGRGVCNVEPLITHSEARANNLSGEYVPDPMLVALTDHNREAREELADARIRLVWKLEESPEDEHREDVFLALRHITLAYDLLQE